MLGAFEELVLLTVVRLDDDAYAVSIRRDLVHRTGTEVAMGAVYATLDRLEEKGMIHPRETGDDRQGEGPGRPRRYLQISRAGISALTRTHTIRDRVWRGIDLAGAESGGDRV